MHVVSYILSDIPYQSHDLSDIKTEKDNVKSTVVSVLENSDFLSIEEEGHVESSYFGGGYIADWFVIGGRWTADLHNFTDKKEDFKKFWDTIDDLTYKYYNCKKQDVGFHVYTYHKEHKKEVQELWEKIMNVTSTNPLDRDSYELFGYDDDTMLLTEDIVSNLTKYFEFDKHKKDALIFKDNSDVFILDIEEDEITEETLKNNIGKKYITVIDYHY